MKEHLVIRSYREKALVKQERARHLLVYRRDIILIFPNLYFPFLCVGEIE